MDFHHSRPIKKTRREHRCTWCCEVIPAGSAAFAHFGVFDGDPYNGHTHGECEAAMRHPAVQDWLADEGYIPGDGVRGRVDDRRWKLPQFNPDGTRTEEPL